MILVQISFLLGKERLSWSNLSEAKIIMFLNPLCLKQDKEPKTVFFWQGMFWAPGIIQQLLWDVETLWKGKFLLKYTPASKAEGCHITPHKDTTQRIEMSMFQRNVTGTVIHTKSSIVHFCWCLKQKVKGCH